MKRKLLTLYQLLTVTLLPCQIRAEGSLTATAVLDTHVVNAAARYSFQITP